MLETQYTMNTKTGQIAPAIDVAQLKAWDEAHVMHTYARLPVTFVRGQGARLYDADGKEYLDFLAGIAVNGLGHCHPRHVRAIQEQAATLIHTSNLYLTGPQAQLAAKLASISDFERVFSAIPVRKPTKPQLKSHGSTARHMEARANIIWSRHIGRSTVERWQQSRQRRSRSIKRHSRLWFLASPMSLLTILRHWKPLSPTRLALSCWSQFKARAAFTPLISRI
jgi:hypothetical protein